MLLRKFRKKLGEKAFGNKVERLVEEMSGFLEPGGRVLDLGAGQGLFTRALQRRGHAVTAVDVVNRSYYPDIPVVIYDGEHLPFPDKSFDICLVIAVLHHAKDDRAVLREAARVARKVIVYEDIYSSRLQRIYISLVDSLLNREFFGHIHHYKTDKSWRADFVEFGLTLAKATFSRTWGWIDNVTYFLYA